MSDLPVVVEPTIEDKKTAAFFAEKIEVDGLKFHPFSAMRKAILEMTRNEILATPTHLKKWCDENQKSLEEIKDEEYWSLLEVAVPEFLFHITALAYVCTQDALTLAKFSKNQDAYRQAVFAWWESLSETQWNAAAVRSFQELIESNVGNDYEVKNEDGAKKSPN